MPEKLGSQRLRLLLSRLPKTFLVLRISLFLVGVSTLAILIEQQTYVLHDTTTTTTTRIAKSEIGILPIAFELEKAIDENINTKKGYYHHDDTDALGRLEDLIGRSDQISTNQKERLSQTIKVLQQKNQTIQPNLLRINTTLTTDRTDKNSTQQNIKASVSVSVSVSVGDDAIAKVLPTSPYAYMFVIGDINEERPSYKGFFYNVLVAARLFHQLESTADIWLYVQMSSDSKTEDLPTTELQILQALNIHVHQLPRAEHDTFTHLVFSKFRALQMTQYRRVIFIDADAIPLANMDYLFHLSDPLHNDTPTILQPNLIMASRQEPCNAGVFMLEPEERGWEHLWEIVKRQRTEGAELPYPHFSWGRGWGHNFAKEKDFWRGTAVNEGKRWKFHAGHSDQGLLYYWVKYVKQHTSIVIKDEVENWIPDAKGGNKPVLLNTLYNQTLLQYAPKDPLVYQMSCDYTIKSKPIAQRALQCFVPYRDFSHFMGKDKPWEKGNPNRFRGMQNAKTSGYISATKLFFDTLDTLNGELFLGLDFDQWRTKHLPQLKNNSIGRMSMFSDLVRDVMTIKNLTESEYRALMGFEEVPSEQD